MTLKSPSTRQGMQDTHRFDLWFGMIPWRRAWQPTPVFLPGEFHEQRSLTGYSPWDCKESDMTEPLIHILHRTLLGTTATRYHFCGQRDMDMKCLPTSHIGVTSSLFLLFLLFFRHLCDQALRPECLSCQGPKQGGHTDVKKANKT